MRFNIRYQSKINEAEMMRTLRGQDGPVGRYGTTMARRATAVAKSKANYDTGYMQSTIYSRTDRKGQELAWVISVGADYGRYVHEGNNNYEGNPFISDAIEEVFGGS